MASKDAKVRKQGTVGKRKYVTYMNPWKLKIITTIRRLESGYSHSVVIVSYIRSSTIYDGKKLKNQLQSFMASSESMKDLFK
jgi:translation initiation factor 1 (eIF-1/SUI1)